MFFFEKKKYKKVKSNTTKDKSDKKGPVIKSKGSNIIIK